MPALPHTWTFAPMEIEGSIRSGARRTTKDGFTLSLHYYPDSSATHGYICRWTCDHAEYEFPATGEADSPAKAIEAAEQACIARRMAPLRRNYPTWEGLMAAIEQANLPWTSRFGGAFHEAVARAEGREAGLLPPRTEPNAGAG